MTSYFGYLRVFYPLHRGRLVLRSERDWDADQEPTAVEQVEDGQRFDFLLEHDRPYLFCKPVIRRPGADGGEETRWAIGANKLAILSEDPQDVYPHFFTGERGRITDVLECPSEVLGRALAVRIYLPAGYSENHLKRYPVLYMHDGRNLFFPQEAFLGREWRIDEQLDRLDAMSLIDRLIVVGVHAGDRLTEYTRPGYEAYGEALAAELKPWVDRGYRTLPAAERTAVMGSSLGGVVSFYLGWQHPGSFGNVACLSSSFGYQDDLHERVRAEALGPRSALKIYLDSGWPADNYEVTLSLANALIERGFRLGSDLVHLAFPLAQHHEPAWAARSHIPLQLFSGKTRRAAELHARPYTTSSRKASRVMRRRPGLAGDGAQG